MPCGLSPTGHMESGTEYLNERPFPRSSYGRLNESGKSDTVKMEVRMENTVGNRGWTRWESVFLMILAVMIAGLLSVSCGTGAPATPAPSPVVIEKEVVKTVEVEVPVIQEVVREVPRDVIVEKEIVKEVPRDVIVEKEVVKTVEVEKSVIKEVQVVVTPTPGPDAFPLSIVHKFGEVTIPQQPRRVVTVGFSEQDPVLALGVDPVAVREWFGGHPYATWPWAQDELGGAQPTVLTMPFGELDYEKIAALRPDIVIATHSGITEQEYERLARIAPTLAQSGDYPDFGMPWQEQTLSIGRALGLEGVAEDAVSDVETKIASAGSRFPQFQGATVAWASPASGQGQYWAVGPTTPPMRFLGSMGFSVPPGLAEVIGDKDSAQISSEQLSLLDVDVLIFQGRSEEGVETFRNDPLFRQLNVARDNRAVYFSSTLDPVYGALSFSTVLSLSYAVDELVPLLADAIDGASPAAMAVKYPVTVNHQYGSTELAEFPQRVVSLGYNEQDALLALGVSPVAVRHWFGDEPFSVFPWAQDALGSAQPEVLRMPFGEMDFEKIASLQPDLISGVYSGMTEDEYRTLSRVAPTIAQSGDYINFGMPWQEQTRLIGLALGLSEEADRIVAEVEGEFEAVQSRHPDWSGKTVVVGNPRGDGQYSFVASEDARSRVFTSMGFVVPEKFDEIAGDSFWGTISLEQAHLLDADLLVIHQMQWVEGGRDALLKDPILSLLKPVKEGRFLFVEGPQDDALQFGTVLSLAYFLDQIEPRIVAAMDGDPATEANP